MTSSTPDKTTNDQNQMDRYEYIQPLSACSSIHPRGVPLIKKIELSHVSKPTVSIVTSSIDETRTR